SDEQLRRLRRGRALYAGRRGRSPRRHVSRHDDRRRVASALRALAARRRRRGLQGAARRRHADAAALGRAGPRHAARVCGARRNKSFEQRARRRPRPRSRAPRRRLHAARAAQLPRLPRSRGVRGRVPRERGADAVLHLAARARAMIEVQGLSKSFGAVRALKDVSFTARDGHIVGLLGPNGAGKSTCLRILSTVLKPDRGTARVGGVDLAADPLAARRLLGALPHNSGLYPQLTARENIEYFGKLHGIPPPKLRVRVDALIERLDLERIADRKAKGFSQGERTKTALARALVYDPQHLLLDE